MKYYEITPLIHSGLAVFPGDRAFLRQASMEFSKGDHLTLSSIQSTLHLGAHADASNHYHPDGEGIDKRSLAPYFGSCQVVHVKAGSSERIMPKHVLVPITQPRVLFRTDSFLNPDQWTSCFNSLSPELIDWLAKKNVSLVGIDTPSIDPEDSKALESHQAIYRNGLCVLEGIVLAKVPAGVYTLVALPLPIQDGDASPVRAILLKDPALLVSELSPVS